MSKRRSRGRASTLKKGKAHKAAGHMLGRAGSIIFAVLILSTLGLSVFLSHISFRSSQMAAVVSARLVDLTNEDRSDSTLGTLTVNPILTAAAQAKANDMAAHSYFAHVSPNGLNSWYWFKQAGYSFSYAGENLAVDFTDSNNVNEAWLNSPTHRDNILNGHYTEIGIATAEGTFEGHPTIFVVQMFGTPASGSVVASQPSNTAEQPIASTQGTQSNVLGNSIAPAKTIAKQPTKKTQTTKLAQNTNVAPKVSVQTLAPAETSAVPMHLTWWQRLAASPHSFLRGSYIVFALCLLLALLVRTRFEFKVHHVKHVYAVLALFMLMGGLFALADHLVFVTPIVGIGQSI